MILINIRCFQRYRFQWTRKTFSPAGQIRSSVLTDVSKLIEILEESVEFGGNRGRNYSNYWKLEIGSRGSMIGRERMTAEQDTIGSLDLEFSWLEVELHIVHVSCVLARDQGRDRSRKLYFFFPPPPFLFSEIWQNLFSIRFVDSLDA